MICIMPKLTLGVGEMRFIFCDLQVSLKYEGHFLCS